MKSRMNGADVAISFHVWPRFRKDLRLALLEYNNEVDEEDEISMSGFIRILLQRALPLVKAETDAKREARLAAKKTKKTEE